MIKERFSIPGRLRFDVDELKADRSLAPLLQAEASLLPGVTRVKVDSRTGSVLFVYAPASEPQNFSFQARSLLEKVLLRRSAAGAAPRESRASGSLSRILRVGSGPSDPLKPVFASVVGSSISNLQNLSLNTIMSVGLGDEVDSLRHLGLKTARSQVQGLGVAAALLTGPGHWGNYLRRRVWKRWSQEFEHRLRANVFEHLEHQDLAFFESHGTGPLLALLTSDIATVAGFVEQLDGVIEASLTVSLAGASMIRNSPRLALVAAVSLPLMLAPIQALRPRTQQAFGARAAGASRLNQALENILAGIVEVKSFTAEEVEQQRVFDLSSALVGSTVEATSLPVAQTTMAGNVYFLGYVPALTFGVLRVLSGKMEKEQLLRSTFWYPKLVAGAGRFQDAAGAYFAAEASANRLAKVLDAKSTIQSGTLRLAASKVRGDIAFENVTFGYAESRPVLKNLSLTVPAGETLGIVGPSGSGKSTLLKLLLRFYDPDSGSIQIDGVDVRQLLIKDLRSSVAVVSQDVYLFNGTVRHNVLYGRSNASDEEVTAALTAAGARDLLDSLPQGLASDVGEHGNRLSGGQRQRVAIARALLKNAPILVLDEPTSHLDYATEAAVKKSLANATEGKTVVLVAHRLTSVRDADSIIVLDQGVITERGTHQELLKQRGLYHSLWQLQS